MTNKTFLPCVTLSTLVHAEAYGQDLHTTVTNLWWEGPKTTDRIVVLSNAVERVVGLGSPETRTPFADHWPWMSVHLDNVLVWLSGTNSIPFEEALHFSDLHPDP